MPTSRSTTSRGREPRAPAPGRSVSTTGVVTARKGNGFFLQAADTDNDADSATSEGVFVFTSSEPAASAAVGSRVRVTGTVLEYRPSSDPSSPPLTEIAGNPQVALLSTGNLLPSPVLLTPADLSAALPADRLERYEGMRVRVDTLLVVAPTGGTVDEPTATAKTNGVFFGVLAGTPRPFREAGFDAGLALPSGSPCCVPRFDGNPERLRVDSDALSGVASLDVAAGTTLSDLVGPLDYAYRTYTLLPESVSSVAGSPAAHAVPVPSTGDLTVGSLNLERFFDAVPSGAGPTLSPEAFEARLKKASLAIRTLLRSPDGTAVVFTVVANHLRSLSGVEEDSSDGRRVRAKRQAQAEFLGSLLSRLQSESPDAILLAVGDFNAYEFSDGLADVIGTLRGAPAPANQVVVNRSVDLVEPDFVDLCATDAFLPPSERYSFVFDGNAQLLDHVLASAATVPRVTGLAFARLGSDFPEAWRADATRPERLTDHDAPVVRLRLDATGRRSATVPRGGLELPVPVRNPRP